MLELISANAVESYLHNGVSSCIRIVYICWSDTIRLISTVLDTVTQHQNVYSVGWT